jgi:hypothetical protein
MTQKGFGMTSKEKNELGFLPPENVFDVKQDESDLDDEEIFEPGNTGDPSNQVL